MTETERFQKVRDLFDATAELPVAQRLEKLHRLTDDESIVQEVMALCAANDEDSTTRFSKPLGSVLQSAAAPALKAGDKLGVWQIGREIGHGGMGSVYFVERVDGHFTQTAALKLVKGLPRAETLNYFSRERQLLAKLSHPNIARLLDGGATNEGQPYLVMEYIDGVAIDVYCQQQKLTTRQILKLFTTACDAVAFSHRQLIVHCDLKPSNLLINQEGRPILLDFGIARLLDRVGAEANDAAIGSSVAYTPRYASPEQREHGTVTTVSDIYSLGIMLGELLGANVAANAAANTELNAVLAKATAADPAKRYVTVEAFSDDIERYLHKLPLRALPASTGYIARKFMQRRWPLVLAGFVFVATVAGFTFTVIAEAQRATVAERAALGERDRAQLAESQAREERDAAARERDRATAAERTAEAERNSAKRAESLAIDERDRARKAERASVQTSDFLVSIFEGSNPNAEITPIPAATLLTQAEKRLEKELKGQPAAQSDIYAALAKVQTNIGNREAAKAHYARALAFERTQDRPLKLAALLYGSALLGTRGFGNDSAERDAREALGLRERYAGARAEVTAESLVQLGSILSIAAKYKEAELLLLRAVAIYRVIPAPSEGLASALMQLGPNFSRQGEPKKAVPALREGLALRLALVGDKDPRYVNDLQQLARALSSAQDYAESEVLFRQAIASIKAASDGESQPYGWANAELARMLSNSGRPLAALPLFAEALVVIEKTLGVNSPSFGVINSNAGNASEAAGDEINADIRYRRAISVLAPIWGESDLSQVRQQYASFLLRIGKFDAARPQIERTLSARRSKLGDSHEDVYATQLLLLRWFVRTGDLAAATALIDTLRQARPALTERQRIALAREQAMIDAMQGRLTAAIAELDRLERLDLQRWGEQDSRYLMNKIDRIEILIRFGSTGEKTQGAALASQLINQLKPILVPNAPALDRLRALVAP